MGAVGRWGCSHTATSYGGMRQTWGMQQTLVWSRRWSWYGTHVHITLCVLSSMAGQSLMQQVTAGGGSWRQKEGGSGVFL